MKVVGCSVALAALSACSDTTGSDAGGGGQSGSGAAGAGQAGDRGSDPHADGGAAGQSTALSIWNDESALLEVHQGDFFSGYSGYKRTRAQMGAALLAELEQVRTAPGLDQCFEDGLNIDFKVSDAAGNVARYRNDSCSDTYQAVDPSAAEHFLKALPECLLSKDVRTAALDTAPSVAIGDGCQNGLFTSSVDITSADPVPRWLRLTVPTANVPVLLELADCGRRTLTLELLDEAGEAVLAEGVPSGNTCQSLSHSFAAAGSYVVRVTLTGGEGAGDFTFRAN